MRKKVQIIPVFVSHMGCPNDCVFCNQKKITGHDEGILPQDLAGYIDAYLATMHADIKAIAFYGGSFTGIDPRLQEAYLRIANDYKESGLIDEIRLSTRPDYINSEVIERLFTFKVDCVELGVQSFDAEVLKRSKRGHSVKSIYDAVHLLKTCGIQFGIQLMYGLPGDSPEKFFFSVNETLKLKPAVARLYPVLVIEETELSQMFLERNYTSLSVEETIPPVAKAYAMLESQGIEVIRVGLQRSDLINKESAVIAGPFHDAYRDLVLDYIIFRVIGQTVTTIKCEEEPGLLKQVTVKIHPKRVSHVRGTQKVNVRRLRETYQININQLIQDKTLEVDDIVIKYKTFEVKLNYINSFGVEVCI